MLCCYCDVAGCEVPREKVLCYLRSLIIGWITLHEAWHSMVLMYFASVLFDEHACLGKKRSNDMESFKSLE